MKYYRAFRPSTPGRKPKLEDAYAVLYDSRHRSLFRVPIFKRSGNTVKDATEHFSELVLEMKTEDKSEKQQGEARAQMMRKLKELGYA